MTQGLSGLAAPIIVYDHTRTRIPEGVAGAGLTSEGRYQDVLFTKQVSFLLVLAIEVRTHRERTF